MNATDQAAEVAVAHMGDCQDVLKAIGAEQIGRYVLNGELGPMGAVEVKLYRGRDGQHVALHSSNGGATLFALATQPATGGTMGGEGIHLWQVRGPNRLLMWETNKTGGQFSDPTVALRAALQNGGE